MWPREYDEWTIFRGFEVTLIFDRALATVFCILLKASEGGRRKSLSPLLLLLLRLPVLVYDVTASRKI